MNIIDVLEGGARFDFQCALMSLPGRLGAEPSGATPAPPYLRAEPERVAHWRAALGEGGLKIGIGWQGNPNGPVDVGRSLPLAAFAPLARIPGARLISLQKGFGLEQIEALAGAFAVETPPAPFDEGPDAFVDTAALMQGLDLIVTSDTSLAHLAGALGVPAWVALKFAPDWRWMFERADSPWYPSLRLFRQRARGEWRDVFEAMASEASAHIARRGATDP